MPWTSFGSWRCCENPETIMTSVSLWLLYRNTQAIRNKFLVGPGCCSLLLIIYILFPINFNQQSTNGEANFTKDWHSATSVARAFQIGEKEAKAVSFLETKIEGGVVKMLRESVRTRGMRQWLTHDLLAAEMFNLGFSSGKSGSLIAWQGELTNLKDNELAPQQLVVEFFIWIIISK